MPFKASETSVPLSLADRRPTTFRDDLAYVLPMLAFVALTQLQSIGPHWLIAIYTLKTLIAAALLIAFRSYYTRIRWNYWWLGAIVGVLVVFQWVGMEKLLWNGHYPKIAHPDLFNPFQEISTPSLRWAFIAVRWGGAALLVPFMEELFWRDWLWRTVAAPNDFKMVPIGVRDWQAFLIVAVAFGAGVHLEWITAIVCGLIYGSLVLFTRSLGAVIVAHAVTNFLLGAYVLKTGDWVFW